MILHGKAWPNGQGLGWECCEPDPEHEKLILDYLRSSGLRAPRKYGPKRKKRELPYLRKPTKMEMQRGWEAAQQRKARGEEMSVVLFV